MSKVFGVILARPILEISGVAKACKPSIELFSVFIAVSFVVAAVEASIDMASIMVEAAVSPVRILLNH